ncbi:MAG: efflux RND transporter periplasmic adaptor subunit [Treponema sp.]|nr:efflux RND transporter periplasmic adaptor subunit [Treponema sp.]
MKGKQFPAAVFALFTVILACAAFAGCARSSKTSKSATYEFTLVRRGNLERTVSSSGTINPVATVKVLPQMSGKVEKVFADYNDLVKRGDILAELNTDVLRLKREQQYASVSKVRANYDLQLINYRNQEALARKNLISEFELKSSKTTLDGYAADLAVAQANLKEIETEINQYAYITSPIDGIVLDRNINVGDTVVDSSSNNSSSIFTIAENLREMQIEALVGELDVTSIHKGQHVRFTLESLPGRRFSGVVETLRMIPVVSNNVVSYTVIINVENHDGSLLPGMTCAADFIVERSENVLMAANAALRYQPTGLSAQQIADMVFNAGLIHMNDEQRQAASQAREQARAQPPDQRQNPNQNQGLTGLMMGQSANVRMRPPGGRQPVERQGRNPAAIVMRNLWYVSNEGRLEVMRVRTGISDGSFTEIITDDLSLENTQVILREKI